MNIKLIATGAGMFGFGALLSWAMTADYFERKMKSNRELLSEMLMRKETEIISLETELMRERVPWTNPSSEEVQAVADKVTGDILSNGDRKEPDLETDSENSPGGTSDENEEYDEKVTEERRTNLQKLIEEYTADPDVRDDFIENAGRMLEYDGNPPFVISRELYASDPDEGDNYAKITIKYYPRHRVLVDDDEEPIDDVANYVGWKSLNQFGGESGDPDVVFVRNRRLATDFEVVQETEEDPPIHITYGMSREAYNANKAAGNIKFRDEDRD